MNLFTIKKVATKILRNRLNMAKYLTDYQKSKHFSNAVKYFSVYGYQLPT